MIVRISELMVSIGLLSYFQIRQLLTKKDKKGILAYGFLMSLAAVVGALLIAGVDIPRQTLLIKIFEPIGKAVLGE